MTDFSAYDDFVKDAETDQRVGEHDAVVDSVELGAWPSGDPRWKVKFMLITASMASCDMTLSELPSPEQLKSDTGMATGKKRAIAGQIRLYRELAENYNVTDVMKIEKGDTFRIKTVKTRIDPMTGKGGFIRVIALLPKDGDIEAPPTAPF